MLTTFSNVRKKMGVTQYKMAKLLGMDAARWHRYEHGKLIPREVTLKKIITVARIYGIEVSRDDLLGKI
jgi:transcriptional regulator with XRE-family HTH domain